jgi:Tfp pilus assembly protein PilX
MKNRGMTLFIAVVIMSILLFISFAVVNITIKGSLFASFGRDSQFAFYAADAGMECALYWDSKYKLSPTEYISAFATSSEGAPRMITCANQSISTGSQTLPTGNPSLIGGGGDANATSTFYFVMGEGSSPVTHCAIVTVNKHYLGSNLITYIKSKGYNTCNTGNLRRVERGIEVTY